LNVLIIFNPPGFALLNPEAIPQLSLLLENKASKSGASSVRFNVLNMMAKTVVKI
jgi:hypothetical protein